MSVLATDNFNRADNADLGANWTPMTGESAWSIASNAATCAVGSDSSERYSGLTWPDDQYAQAVIKQIGTAGSDVGPAILLRGASGARTFYRLLASAIGSGTSDSWVSKQVAGSYTNIAAVDSSGTWAVNDVIYGEVKGTTIKLKRGAAEIISTTDSAIASGSPGIGYSGADSSAPILDDWEAGDFSAFAYVAQTDRKRTTRPRPFAPGLAR